MLFDRDEDGVLSFQELQVVMKSMGQRPSGGGFSLKELFIKVAICFRNLCFCSLAAMNHKSIFLAVSFAMRVLVSIGEASILPSAIAVGKQPYSDLNQFF